MTVFDARQGGTAIGPTRTGLMTPYVLRRTVNFASVNSGGAVTTSDTIKLMAIPTNHYCQFIGLEVVSATGTNMTATLSARGTTYCSGSLATAAMLQIETAALSGNVGAFFTSGSAVDVILTLTSGAISGVGIVSVYAYVTPLARQ